MEFLQPLAVLGMLFIGFGVMFRVVRPRVVVPFMLFLVFLSGVLGNHLSWQAWIVVILGSLIGLRIFIDRKFRRK